MATVRFYKYLISKYSGFRDFRRVQTGTNAQSDRDVLAHDSAKPGSIWGIIKNCPTVINDLGRAGFSSDWPGPEATEDHSL